MPRIDAGACGFSAETQQAVRRATFMASLRCCCFYDAIGYWWIWYDRSDDS